MVDLDADPSTIESWVEFCKACKDAGKLQHFKKTLSDYLWRLNMQETVKLQEYGVRRTGEIYRDEQEDRFRKRRLAKESLLMNREDSPEKLPGKDQEDKV